MKSKIIEACKKPYFCVCNKCINEDKINEYERVLDFLNDMNTKPLDDEFTGEVADACITLQFINKFVKRNKKKI